jgi:ribonuclease BN (tRNA processing enzyme)
VHFLGTGTPLGLEGLHQACILIENGHQKLLVDCGMTALASLGRAHVDLRDIDAVLISHLHGDHFGGLAPLLLDASMRPRQKPLTIAGPAQTRERAAECLKLFGWTSASVDVAEFVVLEPGQTTTIGGCAVTAHQVPHNPATAPTGLRITLQGRTIGYSGDAGWSEALVEIARGVDLFICGVWWLNVRDPSFVDLATVVAQRDQLQCRRMLLTHLGPEVLERRAEVPFEVATDGLVIQL